MHNFIKVIYFGDTPRNSQVSLLTLLLSPDSEIIPGNDHNAGG